LEFQLHTTAQVTPRWSVNGETVSMKGVKAEDAGQNHLLFRKTLPLKAGWNEVRLRAYCVGYTPFKAGLVLDGPPEKLWDIQFSATPPAKP
jgi:hypothetical protein